MTSRISMVPVWRFLSTTNNISIVKNSTLRALSSTATSPSATSATAASSSASVYVAATDGPPEIVASIRATGISGSRKSRSLRDQGKIPGVFYGLDEEKNVLKRMVTVDMKIIAAELRERKNSFENTIYRLRLDDNTTHYVTPRQLQVHPCKFSLSSVWRFPFNLMNAAPIHHHLLTCT